MLQDSLDKDLVITSILSFEQRWLLMKRLEKVFQRFGSLEEAIL